MIILDSGGFPGWNRYDAGGKWPVFKRSTEHLRQENYSACLDKQTSRKRVSTFLLYDLFRSWMYWRRREQVLQNFTVVIHRE